MKIRWEKIEDFRDDAILCGPRWEISDLDEVEREIGELDECDLPALPAGADHAYRRDGRWLCA